MAPLLLIGWIRQCFSLQPPKFRHLNPELSSSLRPSLEPPSSLCPRLKSPSPPLSQRRVAELPRLRLESQVSFIPAWSRRSSLHLSPELPSSFSFLDPRVVSDHLELRHNPQSEAVELPSCQPRVAELHPSQNLVAVFSPFQPGAAEFLPSLVGAPGLPISQPESADFFLSQHGAAQLSPPYPGFEPLS